MESKIERSELDVLEEILQEVQENNEFIQKLLADGESQDQGEERKLQVEMQDEYPVSHGDEEIKDTPEEEDVQEWEKEYEKQFGKYIKNANIGRYDQNGVNIGWISAKDLLRDFIEQLLEEREREVLEEQWNIVKQKGYWEGREDEKFIQGLTKLNKEK